MNSQERKDRTEELLKSYNIPINKWLPFIEGEEDVKVRSSDKIAKRILILAYLGAIAEPDFDRLEIIQFVKQENLWDEVSKDEKLLFCKDVLTKKEKINISWRCEAIKLLLWAIKKIEILEMPIDECNIYEEILSILPDFLESSSEFIAYATVRNTSDLLDMSDLLYRLHWAARDADLKKKKLPIPLNTGIIVERHYAINWVLCYNDEDDWDQITTDT